MQGDVSAGASPAKHFEIGSPLWDRETIPLGECVEYWVKDAGKIVGRVGDDYLIEDHTGVVIPVKTENVVSPVATSRKDPDEEGWMFSKDDPWRLAILNQLEPL